MSTLTLSPSVVATHPYPVLGGSQHLCLVRHSGSERLSSPFTLDWHDLPQTVLASAFLPDAEVTLPVPLPPPFDRLILPPLSLDQLRPRLAKDPNGRVIGMLLSIPGLWVVANQILMNGLQQNPRYNYQEGIFQMSLEAARLLAQVVRNGVLRVRERPGFMGHAIAMGELAPDEIAISTEFASIFLKQNRKRLQGLVDTLWQLDGFPCWGTRFPVANEFGLQQKVLRVVEGRGNFVGFHPWDLGKRYLGDQDGDLGFGLLRAHEILDGKAFTTARPRIQMQNEVTAIRNPLTLQNVLDPSLLHGYPKSEKLEQAELSTLEKRLGFIEDCDTRMMVAVLTMVLGWWCPRVLATRGELGVQEAYVRCHQMMEWFLEQSFDARKEGSPFSTPGFDAYAFLDTLMQGGSLDFEQLTHIGAPEHAVATLAAAWTASNGNLREACSISPVYAALVLKRRQMGAATVDMLESLQQLGVQPADLYRTIIEDLTAVAPLAGNLSQAPMSMGEMDFDFDEMGES